MIGDPEARHVARHPRQATRFADVGLQLLKEAGVAGIIEHYSEDSQIALPRFLREGRRFALAFVDGNHRFDGVFVDPVYLGRLLRPGGIVVLDNYHLPAIARAASFFLKNLDWTLDEMSPVDDLHQWVVLRTPPDAATRPFDYFVDF